MGLPFYHIYNVRSPSFEDISHLLTPDLNLKFPVVFNLLAIDRDQQREIIGLIENFFVSANISYLFPYPVYILTEHESSISSLPLVRSMRELPKFYQQREGKLNVKENHVAEKNRLIQQEIKNYDAAETQKQCTSFADIHREIFILEEERLFYKSVFTRLMEAKNG
jgi:hypothetical protein